MSSLPGILGVLVFLYARPHEMVRALAPYNALYACFGLAIVGFLHDVVERRARIFTTPALPYVIAFTLWCVLTLALRGPASLGTGAASIVVCLMLYVVLAHGVQRAATLTKVCGVVLALGVFVAGVGFAQGTSPFQCVVYNPAQANAKAIPMGIECAVTEPDGSPHDGVVDCLLAGDGRLPYRCERVGPFDTTSVGGGRVRYLGILLDPNDLALATAIAVPFAFALAAIRRSITRVLLLLGSLGVIGGEVVMTQSRGGQLTFGAVLGTYFVERYGWKRGAFVGAAAAVPVLLVGGRSDGAADESTMERLGCAAAGIKMLLTYPFTGVGYTLFVQHHPQTAHNAYLLAAGELGLLGMWLFAFVFYLSLKIPLTILRSDFGPWPDAHKVNALALALVAALVGAAVGVFFLSWTYHYVLWLYFGLAGALYSVVKRAFPAFECRLSLREAVRVAGGYVLLIAVWSAYIARKGAWR
jgi:hypothetical protein